jgi:hypothetical protein
VTELLTRVVGPAARPPDRRPNSVRRTSTLVMSWPDGILAGVETLGRCRDLYTGRDGRAAVLDEADLVTRTTLERTIESASSPPTAASRRPQPDLSALVGARAGGGLRGAIAGAVPDLLAEAAPLYLLLDDLAGASLIAGFAWFPWRDHLPELAERRQRRPVRPMQGVCSGFRPGASSLTADGTQASVPTDVIEVPPLVDPADPLGWHEQHRRPAMAMRRARRIDLWEADGLLRVDAMFRDSCWAPGGAEIAAHEYQLFATADRGRGRLLSVEALPRVLPYQECPLAADNIGVLEGLPLAGLREEVLARLRGIAGCTHLNDALRALAEVPVLAAALEPGPAGPRASV